jgi:hypothetical protein
LTTTATTNAAPAATATTTMQQLSESKWGELNLLFRRHDFLPIFTPSEQAGGPTMPDVDMLLDRMREVFRLYDRRGEIVQEQALSNASGGTDVIAKQRAQLTTVETQLRDSEKASRAAEMRIVELEELLNASQSQTREKMRQLQASNSSLKDKLSQSEHRVRAKEKVIERMQQRLQSEVNKESLTKERQQEMFKEYHRRDPRSASATDTKSMQLIQVYEAQLDTLRDENGFLKSELEELEASLKARENELARVGETLSHGGSDGGGHDVGAYGLRESSNVRGGWRASHVNELMSRVDETRREQEAASDDLNRREVQVVRKVARLEDQLSQYQHRCSELEEDNENLKLELGSRPSVRDWTTAQRRMSSLERQIEAKEQEVQESRDARELRKYTSTASQIKKDRDNHRLKLHKIHSLPRETSRELLMECCRELDIDDVSMIVPSITKINKVMSAVPRMEKFIREVCGFVFMHSMKDQENGSQNSEDGSTSFEGTLEDVFPTLKRWLKSLRQLGDLKEFRLLIEAELLRRPAGYGASISGQKPTALSPSQAAVALRDLVDLERRILKQGATFKQANEMIGANPELLVSRIVRHFQHLFGVKNMEGLFPKINEVYLFVNEQDSFLKNLKGMLGVGTDGSNALVLSQIQQLVDGVDGGGFVMPRQRGDQDRGGSKRNRAKSRDTTREETGNYVVGGHGIGVGGGGDARELAGVAQVREMNKIVSDLKRLLGAASLTVCM